MYSPCSTFLRFLGGHVYHQQCMTEFLNTGRRTVRRLCPSCRAPFETPIGLYFDGRFASSQTCDSVAPQTWEPNVMVNQQYRDNEEVVLPDISFYEENMASLQSANNELSNTIAELERTLVVFKNRFEAQEEAKLELQRQVEELGQWLARVRKADGEKDVLIRRLSEEREDLRVENSDLAEERDMLLAENQHYQSLRVTDDMMRILRSLQSAEIQSQIAGLRSASKDEVITQLQIALEMYCQVKEKLEHSQEELLDSKIELENQKRELIECRKAAKNQGHKHEKSKRSTDQQNQSSIIIDLENETNIADGDSTRNSGHRQSVLNVPAKFVQKRNGRLLFPDGAGGSKGVVETNSGKRFIM